MQHRRGFFQTIASAIAGVALVPTTTLRAASTSAPTWLVDELPPGWIWISTRELVMASLRTLGVIAAGETPTEVELYSGRWALGTLDAEFLRCEVDRPVKRPAAMVHWLRHALAYELAPEFGVSRGWGYMNAAYQNVSEEPPELGDLNQMIDRWNSVPLVLGGGR
jgi:hypothetical protein